MDENVRKSWQLAPDQVNIKNPLWHSGMERLTVTIADRLGYKGVPMQCLLYKMLVYRKGGHFVKHQDTEKEDGMVATLVVQLPSFHEGGDLVVFRRGEVKHRHDFGKDEGTAAYLPHYAVHYADAEHALEKVTSGHRLVLVYSLCLPPTMRHVMRNHDQSLSEELGTVINGMADEDDSFALLLSHEYTEKSIQDLGSRALKGIDRARTQALEEANAFLSSDKKLQLFITKLELDVQYYDDGGNWEESDRNESIRCERDAVSFLGESWKHLGNSGATRSTTYSRYALAAWPAAKGVVNAFKFINVNAAVGALQAQRPVDAGTLRGFMDAVCAKLAESRQTHSWNQTTSVSVGFCRSMCDLLVDSEDPALVQFFFINFVNSLSQYESKDALVPRFTVLARSFNWNDIGQALVNSLGGTVDPTGLRLYVHEENDSGLKMALRIVGDLESGLAQQGLLRVAAEKAARLRDETLCASGAIDLLWKWAIKNENRTMFDIVTRKFMQTQPNLQQPVIEAFSKYIGYIDASDDRFATLAFIAGKRIEWLNNQLLSMGQSFSWEVPDAFFPDNAHVLAFLRGPNVSMFTIGVRHFNGVGHARNYAAKWMREKQANASFILEPEGRGQNAYVIITKTRSWFSANQKKLVEYQAELQLLMQRYFCGYH